MHCRREKWMMARRLMALLAALLCLCSAAAAQEPVYSSTRAFAAVLREAGVPYEANGVDAADEDSLTIEQGDLSVYCFFPADGKEVCFIVWYVIEYDPAQETDVILVCSRLNESSEGPRFYADPGDCTVTATMEIMLPFEAAGIVAYRGYERLAAMLPAAVEALAPYDQLRAGDDVIEEPIAEDVVEEAMDSQPEDIVEEEITDDVTEDAIVPAVTPQPPVYSLTTPAPRPTVAPQADVPQRIVITAATARVRSGPSGSSPYLCTVRQGEAYPVIGVSGDWYIITVDGRTGFVSNSVAMPEQ